MTSALYKDWITSGMGELAPDAHEELMARLQLEKAPPMLLPLGEIGYDPRKNIFHYRPVGGPYIATNNVEALMMLIVANGSENMTVRHLLKLPSTEYTNQARNAVVPVQEVEVPAELAQVPDEFRDRAKRLAASMRDRMSNGPSGSPGSGTEVTIKDGQAIKTEGQE